MSESENRNSEGKKSDGIFYASESPNGNIGDNVRVNGEYHYKSGYTQRLYTDATYSPADEETAPPHYYTPGGRTSSNEIKKQPKHTKKNATGLIALCLVCALLGGIAGAALVGTYCYSAMQKMQDQIDAIPVLITEKHTEDATASESKASENTEENSLSEIYDMACRQTVGIKTDVTYTNFFGMSSSTAVSGSGFVVTANGYIVTNYHVIESASKNNYKVKVMFYDGSEYDATIVGYESSNDIAVLKIDADGLQPVSLGDSDQLKVGDDVYAVGNPLGELEFSMTFGKVSALNRMIVSESANEAINMFQLDAAVNSGNSGGPVYDKDGEVVGIVTAKYSSNGIEGLGFAIPVNDVLVIANDLITKGYVTGKAYLGVKIDERYTSLYSRYYNMPLGAYVYAVYSGSCADSSGVRAGDIITAIGDDTIQSYSDLKTALRQYHAGDTATLSVYRSGQMIELTVLLDEATSSGENGI